MEFDTLKQAHEDGDPVVQVLVEKHESFQAYTMKPVGSTCFNHSCNNVFLLFSSLFNLHSFGWYHGDARWQNAIMFDEKILWCDFLMARKLTSLDPYYRASDLHKLVDSLIRNEVIKCKRGSYLLTCYFEMHRRLRWKGALDVDGNP